MNKFKEWMELVNKTNNTFKKANKARKRVIIAKDVIKALNSALFNSSGSSGYFDIVDYRVEDEIYALPGNKDFRDVLLEKAPSCDVCAKGAIFTCMVMRRDKITVDEKNNIGWLFSGNSAPPGRTGLATALGDIFEVRQLNIIEKCYEQFYPCGPGGEAFVIYGKGKHRLIAIMNNIIRNKGTFKPELEREQIGRSAND